MNLPDLTKIRVIDKTEQIADTVTAINTNYSTLQLWVSALQQEYDLTWQPLVDYYNKYGVYLSDALTLATNLSGSWDDFQTTVETTSSKWIQPFTIFYPNLIKDSVKDSDISNITDWMNKYFPIVNSDLSINYVQGQKTIVNCYTYSLNEQFNFIAEPYSYVHCTAHSGTIYAHCQTIVTGGTVHCSNASYNCNATFDCYPSKHVDCWYSSPYVYDIPPYGIPIPDVSVQPVPATNSASYPSYVATRQQARSQIQGKLNMEFTDRDDSNMQSLIFIVNECSWTYDGGLIY